MIHTRRRLALGGALVLASGLMMGISTTTAANAAPTTASSAASASVPRQTVHVHITAGHRVIMPAVVRPSVNKYVVTSAKSAGFQLIRNRLGYTKREAARDINRAFSQNDAKAMKRFERNIILLGGVASSPDHPGVAWLRVPAGRVWALDTAPSKTDPDKILTIHARGPHTNRMVTGDRTIRAIKETTWASTPKAIPTHGVLKFANRSADNHFVVIQRLKKGKTVADFKAWVDAVTSGQNAGPPPLRENAPGIDTGVVSPDHAMAQRYHLPAGKYVLLCFWPDAEMQMTPHAFMGMYRGLTVK